MDESLKLGYFVGVTQFRRISDKLQIDGDKIYKENGYNFKSSWFPVFFTLFYIPDSTTITVTTTVLTLAKSIGVSHITIKNVVRELAAEKLVRIEDHPTDKRSKHIKITENGKQLVGKLSKIWIDYANTLENLFNVGHPNLLNILNRIEKDLKKNPINEQFKKQSILPKIAIIDYKPSLKKTFYEISGRWLIEQLKGSIEEEDNFTLHHPDQAYLLSGGFIFFALYNDEPVGCIALKRLSENSFEFAKLFIKPKARNLGIATKLIERCITRCQENGASQLWMQTTMENPETYRLYYRLGFVEDKPPTQMKVLRQTVKIMVHNLEG
ncbi:MAG: bifunctional helix-turn-helix transcriptional regulator/GNAT family N-acetyltransferase [Pedobacter sp.]|nr:bifunctional helix-turn-helix transcriptional regulator/GNAT family N-acetyltransferase [Pedobacter sp.]